MSAMRLIGGGLALAAALGTAPAQDEPWQNLFDGKLPINFRGYKQNGFPFNIWSARAGVLSTVPGNDRVDLLIRQACTNFEFSVEWRVAPGASSGIIYLVQEGPQRAAQAGLKFTLADSEKMVEARNNPLFRTGTLYGLLPAKGARPKPAGEWNEARVVVNTNHVEHWLNGDKVLEFDLGGELLTSAIKRSRLKDWPDFDEPAERFIVLEHSGTAAAFRFPKIRLLPAPEPVEILPPENQDTPAKTEPAPKLD